MKPLDSAVKQDLLAPFDASEVRIRTQPTIQPYATARVVMSRLDDVLPFQWSFTLGDHWYDDKGVLHMRGILTVLGSQGILNYEDVGIAPSDMGKGQLKQSKHAVSDCLKRCAVHVGISRYLYELQGVQAGLLPENSVRKALLAVGWKGTVETKHFGKIGGIRHLDLEDEDGEGVPSAESAPAPLPNPLATEAEQERLARACEEGGGNPHSVSFTNWLSGNTSNKATSIVTVYSREVDGIIKKLNVIAGQRVGK